MDLLEQELEKMNLTGVDFSLLDQREETLLARLTWGNTPCVLKCYRSEGARREIRNYALLSSLGIPTPRLLCQTESAILMEDLSSHPIYRLGKETDLSSPLIAEKIAGWYRALHHRSRNNPDLQKYALYEEASHFSRQNIAALPGHTNTAHLSVWTTLNRHFDDILSIYQHVPKVLNYNDFYYTNLAVAKDHSRVMMFDYHLLGIGYAFADVRNVCSSLSLDAQKAFLCAYGTPDPLEQALDAVLSPIITLHLACQRAEFPSWAKESLAFLGNGLEDAIHQLLAMK